jgi:feruloyl-CoA synthase
MSGIIGVPVPGVTIKLVPDEGVRYEVRAKGPNVTTGYLDNPEGTRDAFDEEGFLRTGDAVKFVDPADMTRGMRFDGRISEDFKLLTGTWVRAANLRLELLAALKEIAADLIITGADRSEVGVMIIPTAAARARNDVHEIDGALAATSLAGEVAAALGAMPAQGSSSRINRAMILAEPPSIADGEITAKGNLNFRKLLDRRARLLARLYDDADPATIHV